jgi:hypothetical protein
MLSSLLELSSEKLDELRRDDIPSSVRESGGWH